MVETLVSPPYERRSNAYTTYITMYTRLPYVRVGLTRLRDVCVDLTRMTYITMYTRPSIYRMRGRMPVYTSTYIRLSYAWSNAGVYVSIYHICLCLCLYLYPPISFFLYLSIFLSLSISLSIYRYGMLRIPLYISLYTYIPLYTPSFYPIPVYNP